MCQHPPNPVSSYGCCRFLSKHPAQHLLCVRDSAGTRDIRSLPTRSSQSVVKRSINLITLNLLLCTSQVLKGEARAFLPPDSGSQQPQEEEGEPIHKLPLSPSDSANSEHLLCAGSWGSDRNKSQLCPEKFTGEILVAFRWSISCFPWVRPLEMTSVHSMIPRSR